MLYTTATYNINGNAERPVSDPQPTQIPTLHRPSNILVYPMWQGRFPCPGSRATAFGTPWHQLTRQQPRSAGAELPPLRRAFLPLSQRGSDVPC